MLNVFNTSCQTVMPMLNCKCNDGMVSVNSGYYTYVHILLAMSVL